MKRSPEELEKLLHQTLRSLPDRRAPRSLESRVLAAIEARAARPWWQQSFAQWPVAARSVFILLAGGIVKLMLMATVWVMAGFNSEQYSNAFSTQFAWLNRIGAAISGTGDFFVLLWHSIPPLYLYGGLACLGALYLALFGLGAAAYRTLYANR
jgi:hypothetical protein